MLRKLTSYNILSQNRHDVNRGVAILVEKNSPLPDLILDQNTQAWVFRSTIYFRGNHSSIGLLPKWEQLWIISHCNHFQPPLQTGHHRRRFQRSPSALDLTSRNQPRGQSNPRLSSRRYKLWVSDPQNHSYQKILSIQHSLEHWSYLLT